MTMRKTPGSRWTERWGFYRIRGVGVVYRVVTCRCRLLLTNLSGLCDIHCALAPQLFIPLRFLKQAAGYRERLRCLIGCRYNPL